MMIDIIFDSKTLKQMMNKCSDFYVKEAVETLVQLFVGETPTLREVCDATIKYCNADKLPFNDGVYLIESPNGKRYAGQSTNFANRLQQYQNNKGSNKHWTRALKKYGIKTLEINHCIIPTACSDIVEIFMILWYDLTDTKKGYNKTSGGKNGWTMSVETKAKMRAAKIGVPKSAEHKATMSMVMTGENHPFFGQKHSKDTKAKQRTAKLGEKNPNTKPVIVNGKLYSCAREASREEFTEFTDNYVSSCIGRNPYSTKIFKVSKDFYAECQRNSIIENITREMYERFNQERGL